MMVWISVKDKLPELDTEVLYCTHKKHIYLGGLISDMESPVYWSHYDLLQDKNVTHWMPLPAPPEE